jgi:hypothetical protein
MIGDGAESRRILEGKLGTALAREVSSLRFRARI